MHDTYLLTYKFDRISSLTVNKGLRHGRGQL